MCRYGTATQEIPSPTEWVRVRAPCGTEARPDSPVLVRGFGLVEPIQWIDHVMSPRMLG
jgi:hypothetical protein